MLYIRATNKIEYLTGASAIPYGALFGSCFYSFPPGFNSHELFSTFPYAYSTRRDSYMPYLMNQLLKSPFSGLYITIQSGEQAVSLPLC